MKKITALALSLLMLASMLQIGIIAETFDPLEDESLVIHYDFEGADYLSNKAPNSTGGNLTATNSEGIYHDSETGTVKNSGKAGLKCAKEDVADIIAGGLYDASSNTAGKDVEYTIFVRFKLDKMVAGKEYRIVDTRAFGTATCRPIFLIYKDGKLICNVGTAAGHSPSLSSFVYEASYIECRYINVAIVVSNTATEGETPALYLKLYYSSGLPSDASSWTEHDFGYIKTSDGSVASTVSPINRDLHLLSTGDMDGVEGVEMDDFRIYNTDLTFDRIVNIIPSGSFSETMDDYLRIHYDFEGDDYLKNKADKGIADLKERTSGTPVSHDAITGTVSNTEAQMGLWCAKEDVSSIVTGEYTLFLRAKLDGVAATTSTTATTYYSLIEMRNMSPDTASRNFALLYADAKVGGNDAVQMQTAVSSAPNTGKWINSSKLDIDEINSRYVNIALVMTNTGTADFPDFTAEMYISGGNNGLTHVKTVSLGGALAEPTRNMYLLSATDSNPTGIVLDDVRFYNTALTSDQINTILSAGTLAHDIYSRGTQTKYEDTNDDSVNDSFAVRFVGAINTLEYDEVGIEIIPSVGSQKGSLKSKTSRTAYTSIIADSEVINASDSYCSHFIVFTVTGIPLDFASETDIAFEYRFFAVKDGKICYSGIETVTFNADGSYV